MIYSSGYEAFVSGVSLGKDPEVDAPLVRAQYRIRGERENAEVVEKMYFDRLLDFVYVELMKGLQKGFVPKRCANCGRWFLQMPGMTYAYCGEPAPGQAGTLSYGACISVCCWWRKSCSYCAGLKSCPTRFGTSMRWCW